MKKTSMKKRVYRKKSLFKKKIVKPMLKSKQFKTAVKNVIHRMAENKTVTADAVNESITPCRGVGSAPYFINLLPLITQGVQQGQRVGNQIRIVKNHIKGYINLLPYSATTNPYVCPIMVKMWVVSWKFANPAFSQPALVDFSTFFQRGSATTNFQGNPLDMIRDVSSDSWTVHKTRSFELSSSLQTSNSTPGTNALYQNPSGAWSIRYSFNLGKYAKTLKYDDTISNNVTNKNLYLIIQTVRADGTTVAAGDIYCKNHFQNTLYFEDL